MLVGAIVVGILARLWAQTRPPNWDFFQWINVSEAALSGQDPYSLYGYNYPEPWLALLAAINALTATPEAFRLVLASVLAVADIAIALLLARRGFTLAGCLFMLSPIVIGISGQHQQVEGIAVALALGAMAVLMTAPDRSSIRGEWIAAGLLGLSLAFKPVFLILPLWLALQPGALGRRAFRLLAPLGIFGVIFSISFLMYAPNTVIGKVLGHGGANNSPVLQAFAPRQLAPWLLDQGAGKVLFVVLLVACGLLFRRLPPFQLALAYSMTAVVFSWAMVNQYLAGPMAAIAVSLNAGFAIWLVLASLYLAGDPAAFALEWVRPIQQHVFLDWEDAMLDLFPWFLIGWVVFVVSVRDPRRPCALLNRAEGADIPTEHARS